MELFVIRNKLCRNTRQRNWYVAFQSLKTPLKGESRIWQWMLPFWLLHSNLATICDVTHCVLQHGWPGHTYEPHLAQIGATSLMKVERPMLNTTAVCELCILVLTISVECWLLLFMCNEVARSYSNWWHRWSIFSTF